VAPVNAEAHEARMDAFYAECERIRVTDLYDSARDARSEARYEDDPRAEPVEAESEPVFACGVDESAGFCG
jgi:hypothetical protein